MRGSRSRRLAMMLTAVGLSASGCNSLLGNADGVYVPKDGGSSDGLASVSSGPSEAGGSSGPDASDAAGSSGSDAAGSSGSDGGSSGGPGDSGKSGSCVLGSSQVGHCTVTH